jgi:hypothetical protein
MREGRPVFKCPVCGSTADDHSIDAHGFVVNDNHGDQSTPISGVLSVQGHYNSSSSVARDIAYARAELAIHQPGKEFDFIPHAYMVSKESQNSVLHGQAFVCCYLVVEKYKPTQP